MFEVVDTLDITLRLLESECEQTIAVFDDRTAMTLKGYIRHPDVMTAYNDALTERYRDTAATARSSTH